MKKFKTSVLSPDSYNPLSVEIDIPKKIVETVQKGLHDIDDRFSVIQLTNPDQDQVLFVLTDEKHPSERYSIEIKKLIKTKKR